MLLSGEELDVEIDFGVKSLRKKNFANREKYMILSASKEIFRAKDLLLNLLNFMTFFPEKHVNQFISD